MTIMRRVFSKETEHWTENNIEIQIAIPFNNEETVLLYEELRVFFNYEGTYIKCQPDYVYWNASTQQTNSALLIYP